MSELLKWQHMFLPCGTTRSDKRNTVESIFETVNLLAEFTKSIFLFMVTTQSSSGRENCINTPVHIAGGSNVWLQSQNWIKVDDNDSSIINIYLFIFILMYLFIDRRFIDYWESV